MTQPPSNNSLVSIRMPKSLFLTLQKLSLQDHYLDVSEHVRSVVRDRWQEAKDPQAYQIKKLRKDISTALNTKSEQTAHQQLIKELERIKESILEEGKTR